MDFFKEAGREGSEERIKALMERSETIKEAVERLDEISSDERMREIARAREKARLDEISRIKYAERKAMEKGLKKGLSEGLEEGQIKGVLIGKKNTARNFLKLGIEPEKVAEVAELSIEEVLELKKRIRKLNIKIIYNVCII